MGAEKGKREVTMRDPRRRSAITEAVAEDIAAKALLFLAEDAERLGRFLALTGLDPVTLRKQARTREVLGAALGHVMEDESTLLAFAANSGLEPAQLAPALVALGVSSPWDSA
jgi:hypothetical protein